MASYQFRAMLRRSVWIQTYFMRVCMMDTLEPWAGGIRMIFTKVSKHVGGSQMVNRLSCDRRSPSPARAFHRGVKRLCDHPIDCVQFREYGYGYWLLMEGVRLLFDLFTYAVPACSASSISFTGTKPLQTCARGHGGRTVRLREACPESSFVSTI